LELTPTFIPKAIPGFSTKVILKKSLITLMLSPSPIPSTFTLRNGIENPFTKSFVTWSTINIESETYNIFKVLP
jgi:hypothetical protein